jgi:hypothetical protein
MNKTIFSARSIDELAEHPAVEWLFKNKQTILYAIAALFIAIIFLFRFVSARTLSAEGDYFQAQNDMTQLQTNSLQASEVDLSRLEAILKRHPELQAKYDGLIAQSLLIDQEVQKAVPFAERTFQRLKNDPVGFYENYANTSLLIGEGQYEQAISQAQQLKGQMDQATEQAGSTLYVFNLIRIAMLHQQLNQVDQERLAWEALQNYQGNLDAVVATEKLFQTDSQSLSHYTDTRRKALNP